MRVGSLLVTVPERVLGSRKRGRRPVRRESDRRDYSFPTLLQPFSRSANERGPSAGGRRGAPRSSPAPRTAGPSFVLPAAFDAAVGHLVGAERRHLVHQHAAEVEPRGGVERVGEVGVKIAGLQAVPRVVREAERLVERRRTSRPRRPGRTPPRTRPSCRASTSPSTVGASTPSSRTSPPARISAPAATRLVDPRLRRGRARRRR